MDKLPLSALERLDRIAELEVQQEADSATMLSLAQTVEVRGALIAALEAEVERLREALAPFAVDNGPFMELRRSMGCECRICEIDWEYGEPDRHADNCPVTIARKALEPAQAEEECDV